jgi:hypothetical protein
MSLFTPLRGVGVPVDGVKNNLEGAEKNGFRGTILSAAQREKLAQTLSSSYVSKEELAEARSLVEGAMHAIESEVGGVGPYNTCAQAYKEPNKARTNLRDAWNDLHRLQERLATITGVPDALKGTFNAIERTTVRAEAAVTIRMIYGFWPGKDILDKIG